MMNIRNSEKWHCQMVQNISSKFFRRKGQDKMEFQSILFLDGQSAIKQEPDFFHDLQLDYLLRQIRGYSRSYSIEPLFYTLPKDIQTIHYRQEIYRDLFRDNSLTDAIGHFCQIMQESRRTYNLSLESEDTICAASYHLEAASGYWDSLLVLEKSFADRELMSEGLRAFREFLHDYLKEAREDKWEEDIEAASRFFSQMQFSLIMETDRITILEETDTQPNFLEELAKLLGNEVSEKDLALPELFPNKLELSTLEENLVHLLNRSNPALFKELKDFYQRRQNFYSEQILCFEQEIQFYLNFEKFKQRTEGLGYALTLPEFTQDNSFRGTGLYDLALVWRSAGQKYGVVDNDFGYPEVSTFFVVTGPNQGGKTTFARSMGQAVYLALMGLPVNAGAFKLPFFEGIATHFEAEEKIQSNSGKLKEEINRLAPMMKEEKQHIFVILNELFTTATTYDATIMGKKVMEHFLKMGCYGIYVTHIQELAEEKTGIVSLSAQVEEGEEKKRTYRILPMKAQGDGYSESLVKEFSLRYEDLIRRLG